MVKIEKTIFEYVVKDVDEETLIHWNDVPVAGLEFVDGKFVLYEANVFKTIWGVATPDGAVKFDYYEQALDYACKVLSEAEFIHMPGSGDSKPFNEVMEFKWTIENVELLDNE